jgi:hypothetical protein
VSGLSLEAKKGARLIETDLRRTRLCGEDLTPIVPSLSLVQLLLSLDSGRNRKIDTRADSAV